jgi:DNA-binding CsgD family transcriptional regulator
MSMKALRDRGRPKHPDILTPAEWRVAELVRHGLTNRSIAEMQDVSIDAVKFHVASILGKLGLSRRSEVRKWTGIRADSNLAQTGVDANFQPAIGILGQIARAVVEVGSVLGLLHLYTFGKFAFFDCGGTRLLLAEEPGDASILYFSVPDIRVAHQNLESKGVSFITAPHLVHRHPDGTEEWMAFFNDNEGRPLAIMSQVATLAPNPGITEEKQR